MSCESDDLLSGADVPNPNILRGAAPTRHDVLPIWRESSEEYKPKMRLKWLVRWIARLALPDADVWPDADRSDESAVRRDGDCPHGTIAMKWTQC